MNPIQEYTLLAPKRVEQTKNIYKFPTPPQKKGPSVTPFTSTHLANAYHKMWEIRLFEEQVYRYFQDGTLYGTTHLSIGQEAAAVGACAALQPDDLITSTHRGHGHAIAKGGALGPMLAELLGKATGTCKGKGGSMHIGHIKDGNLGANGIVGGGLPIAVGAALAAQLQGKSQVTLCFFGDGSTSEGSFHESLNLASVWQLPVIFFCENNGYGLSTPTQNAMNISQISKRAQAYNIPGIELDGNSYQEVYTATAEARTHALTKGPILLVANTYRHMGHSKSDPCLYRPQGELEEWQKKDPIHRLGEQLSKAGLSQAQIHQLKASAQASLTAAIQFAETSPTPTPQALWEDIYKG